MLTEFACLAVLPLLALPFKLVDFVAAVATDVDKGSLQAQHTMLFRRPCEDDVLCLGVL